jgi:hypothetical protein
VLLPLLTNIVSRIFVKYILRITPLYELYKPWIDAFDSLEELACAVLALILNIISFVVFFFLCRAIINGVFTFFYKVLQKKNKDDMNYVRQENAFLYRHDKLMGGIVGAISAVLVTMTLISPIMGTLELVDKTCAVVDGVGEDPWEKMRLKKSEIDLVRRYYYDIPGSVLYHMGGKYIFRAATCTIMYDQRVSLFEELDSVANVAAKAVDAYGVMAAPEKADSDDAEKISALGESLVEVKMTRGLVADLLSFGAKTWREGGEIISIPKPNMPQLIQKPFDEILLACEDSNKDSIKYNILTLFNICALVIETDLIHIDISDYNAAIRFLNETRLIDRVNEELSRNPYMNHIRVTSITMSAIAQQLNSDLLTPEQYDELSGGLADMINQINGMNYNGVDEKAEVLKDSAKKYITDAMGEDVEIPEEVIEAVSVELLQELEGKENVTAEDIKDIFDRYAKQ